MGISHIVLSVAVPTTATIWIRLANPPMQQISAASEVLREGLRLLEKEELLKQISIRSLPELEAKLLQAADSLT